MNKRDDATVATRQTIAVNIHNARRVLDAARQSLEAVEKSANIRLIKSEVAKTGSSRTDE